MCVAGLIGRRYHSRADLQSPWWGPQAVWSPMAAYAKSTSQGEGGECHKVRKKAETVS